MSGFFDVQNPPHSQRGRSMGPRPEPQEVWKVVGNSSNMLVDCPPPSYPPPANDPLEDEVANFEGQASNDPLEDEVANFEGFMLGSVKQEVVQKIQEAVRQLRTEITGELKTFKDWVREELQSLTRMDAELLQRLRDSESLLKDIQQDNLATILDYRTSWESAILERDEQMSRNTALQDDIKRATDQQAAEQADLLSRITKLERSLNGGLANAAATLSATASDTPQETPGSSLAELQETLKGVVNLLPSAIDPDGAGGRIAFQAGLHPITASSTDIQASNAQTNSTITSAPQSRSTGTPIFAAPAAVISRHGTPNAAGSTPSAGASPRMAVRRVVRKVPSTQCLASGTPSAPLPVTPPVQSTRTALLASVESQSSETTSLVTAQSPPMTAPMVVGPFVSGRPLSGQMSSPPRR